MFGRQSNAVSVRFLQTHYSDAALDQLLSASSKGRVDYTNPSGCLVGRADIGDNYFHHPAARAYLSFELRYFPLTNLRFVNWRLSRLIKREIGRRIEGTSLTEALQRGSTKIALNSEQVQHSRGGLKPSKEAVEMESRK